MERRIIGVVCLEVTSKVVGSCELASAAVAHERFVARVEPRVTAEVSEPREHVTALGAHEGLLRSVARVLATQVLPQLCRVRQDLVAFSTLTHAHDTDESAAICHTSRLSD